MNRRELFHPYPWRRGLSAFPSITVGLLYAFFTCALGSTAALAISPDKAPTSDPSPDSELASFIIHPEFEVTLYADETLGIADPVALQWDERGRLWVLCTAAYAQLRPGEVPNDKLFVLEDTDGDGKADRSTVFADGLNQPLGFAFAHGGVWVAAESELLCFRDLDGDDRADEKKVILTGFGTADTHQNISNLVSDAGGFLYFSQGLHTYSQVETPWGLVRGDSAGFWRFNPRTQQLSPYGFPEMTSQNPCGIALDQWGALFVKSNDPELCFATPALIPTTHPRELMKFGQIGRTPGKSMGGDIVSSAHLPEWMDKHAIIAGYFAREVSAIPLIEEGAGFQSSPPVQLIFGNHESFRPVDIRQGPDGAIYIADWYNPIINHYQVSLRHPDRDYDHGRVWRLAAKGREKMKRPPLETMDADALVQQLRNPERWPREQARRLLSEHADVDAVVQSLHKALGEWGGKEALALAEAAGVLEALGRVDGDFLTTLAASPEPHVRAIAARIIARSPSPIPDAAERLTKLAADPHPRVRLEAVIACANQAPTAETPLTEFFKIALTALDAGEDRFIDYSLGQTVFALESAWLPPLQEGKLHFSRPEHLAYVLETYGGPVSTEIARNSLASEKDATMRSRLLAVLTKLGDAKDVAMALKEACERRDVALLTQLAASATALGDGDASPLLPLLSDSDPALVIAALKLTGHWKLPSSIDAVKAIATDGQRADDIRTEALDALAKAGGKAVAPLLQTIAEDSAPSPAVHKAALKALAAADAGAAAKLLLDKLNAEGDALDPFVTKLLPALLSATNGPSALSIQLENAPTLTTAKAQKIIDAMNRLGLTHHRLTPMLDEAAGRVSGAPPYDAARVASVVDAVRAQKGDAGRGKEIYQRPQLACTSCHQVGDAGGVIGPALDTVGAGLPLDQIVESILWPERQIKEGYQAQSLKTRAGATILGYVVREEKGLIWYRNTTTPWIQPLASEDVVERETIPSLMPPGLTTSLSEQEFLDLVAYLASLKG